MLCISISILFVMYNLCVCVCDCICVIAWCTVQVLCVDHTIGHAENIVPFQLSHSKYIWLDRKQKEIENKKKETSANDFDRSSIAMPASSCDSGDRLISYVSVHV